MILGPDPDLTREEGAERVRRALQRAAAGVLFIESTDEKFWQFQQDGWVQICMLRPALMVGKKLSRVRRKPMETGSRRSKGGCAGWGLQRSHKLMCGCMFFSSQKQRYGTGDSAHNSTVAQPHGAMRIVGRYGIFHAICDATWAPHMICPSRSGRAGFHESAGRHIAGERRSAVRAPSCQSGGRRVQEFAVADP